MRYEFEVDNRDLRDLAGGRVAVSRPGHPAFPVRLGSEMFRRAIDLGAPAGPVQLWDPLCGSAYLLWAIGLRNRDVLTRILASDADPAAVELARTNLDLLSAAGLHRRATELEDRGVRLAKPSYHEAAAAARRLAAGLDRSGGDVPAEVSRLNIFDAEAVAEFIRDRPVDIVIADVPHGVQTDWAGPADPAPSTPLVAFHHAVDRAIDGPFTLALATPKLPRLPAGLPNPDRHDRVGHRSLLYWRMP